MLLACSIAATRIHTIKMCLRIEGFNWHWMDYFERASLVIELIVLKILINTSRFINKKEPRCRQLHDQDTAETLHLTCEISDYI